MPSLPQLVHSLNVYLVCVRLLEGAGRLLAGHARCLSEIGERVHLVVLQDAAAVDSALV